jgi:hypothetical protein
MLKGVLFCSNWSPPQQSSPERLDAWNKRGNFFRTYLFAEGKKISEEYAIGLGYMLSRKLCV